VLLGLLQLGQLVEFDQLAVDAEAHVALACICANTSSNSPLRSRATGASTISLVSSGSASTVSTICETVCEVQRDVVDGAVRRAGAREQQPQVVVDLGDGADGGARVVAGGLLLDRDRGRQALDQVDVGLVHQLQELPRIGRQALDVAALALGIQGVEGERRLARARQAGDHHQLVARQVEVDVLEVVRARPAPLEAASRPRS
jgi:hypothetical protein